MFYLNQGDTRGRLNVSLFLGPTSSWESWASNSVCITWQSQHSVGIKNKNKAKQYLKMVKGSINAFVGPTFTAHDGVVIPLNL